MKKRKSKFIPITGSIVCSTAIGLLSVFPSYAGNVSSVLPSAGLDYAISSSQVSLSSLQDHVASSLVVSNGSMTAGVASVVKSTAKNIAETSMLDADILNDLEAKTDEENFENLVIAKVNDYVHVRKEPNTDSESVGKLYNRSVGTFLEEKDGWYKIKSGSVTGYVKAEYCVTGKDAVELAPKVGTRIATVTTTTLKVRSGASQDADVIGLVPIEEELVVKDEQEGWVKVDIEEGQGYVSNDYVKLSTEFVEAESKAEEEARLAKEKAEQEAAIKAAMAEARRSRQESQKQARGGKGKTSSGSGKSYRPAESYTTASSGMGNAVKDYALQFVGNPYVYGGTSLTNGTDCSGFVMSVYKNFGVSLPHSSAGDRSVGAAVDGLANAQPGDLVCYSGHVALYIGGGQIVHASTSRTGIIVSNANYRTPLSVRRVF